MKEAKGYEESIIYDAFRILGVTPNEKGHCWKQLLENIIEFYFDKFIDDSKYVYGHMTLKVDVVELEITSSYAIFHAGGLFFRMWASELHTRLKNRLEMMRVENPEPTSKVPEPQPDKEVELYIQMMKKIKQLQRENEYLYQCLEKK